MLLTVSEIECFFCPAAGPFEYYCWQNTTDLIRKATTTAAHEMNGGIVMFFS